MKTRIDKIAKRYKLAVEINHPELKKFKGQLVHAVGIHLTYTKVEK